MSRRKKPLGETEKQAHIRRMMEAISNKATRSEKVSWDRKMDNMVKIIAKLKPIEDQIIDLMAQKVPIIDEITQLRKEMVEQCVHPYTHLTYHVDEQGNELVICKFCNKRFKVMKNGITND